MILILIASLSASPVYQPSLADPGRLQAPGSNFRYDYIDIGTGREDYSGLNVEADILQVNASLELNDTWFTRFGYGMNSVEVLPLSVDQTALQVGLGIHSMMARQIDIYGVVSYVEYDFETTIGGVDQNTPGIDGISYTVGARMHTSSWLELDINYTSIEVDNLENDPRIGLTALIGVSSAFSLGATYSTSDDSDILGMGLRIYF